jgi:Ni/Fe-hydrogenase 1 B-type cytochrome subunit
MWFFILVTLVHVYLVFYHDYVEGHGVMSSMVSGWKFLPLDEDDEVEVVRKVPHIKAKDRE